MKTFKRNAALSVISVMTGILLFISCSSKKPEGIYQVYKSKEGYDKMMELYKGYLSLWPVPYQEIDVDTSWGKTHVIKSGLNNKKPLIVLPGGGGNAAVTVFDPMFAKEYAVYNIDVLGEPGKSVPLRIPEKPKEVADWLNEVVIGLGIEKADIIGMSNGGFIGHWFLNYYPNRVSKLVMISYSYMDQTPPVSTLIPLMYYNIINTAGTVEAIIEKINAGRIKDFKFRLVFTNHLYQVNRYCRMRSYNTYDSVPATEVKKVKTPVLIIMGEKDCLFDSKKAGDFCKQINNQYIHFEMIKGMGHLFGNYMDQVFGMTFDFLKQNGATVALK